MWGNAEKGLAHDNERRDVKKGVWSQIVKIYPVIEHETMNEGVESVP